MAKPEAHQVSELSRLTSIPVARPLFEERFFSFVKPRSLQTNNVAFIYNFYVFYIYNILQ